MIETLTEKLNLPAKSFGATTLNRADLEHGAEPDSCYYIHHVHQIEGRQVDLATDPPPDLILEIDVSSPSSRRLDICKHLGVPEIWRYVGGNVQIYRRQDGEYMLSDQSLSFPLVSAIIINQFLQQAETRDDTTFIRRGANGYGNRSPQNLRRLGCNRRASSQEFFDCTTRANFQVSSITDLLPSVRAHRAIRGSQPALSEQSGYALNFPVSAIGVSGRSSRGENNEPKKGRLPDAAPRVVRYSWLWRCRR